MLRLAEDDCSAAQGAASRGVKSALDLYPGLRCLQSSAHAKLSHRSSGGISRGPKCVSSGIKLEPKATRTPTSKLFDIRNDQKQKEKLAANQFFSSLLEIGEHPTLGVCCWIS